VLALAVSYLAWRGRTARQAPTWTSRGELVSRVMLGASIAIALLAWPVVSSNCPS
jgi:hypothetical protein